MKHSRKHRGLAILLFVLMLLAGSSAWFIGDKLSRIRYSDGRSMPNPIVIFERHDEGASGDAAAEAVIDETKMSALEEAEVRHSDMEIFSDSDVFNILLLGTDERIAEFSVNARADSIMLLSLDRRQASIKLVSLERGMGVPILEGPYRGQYDWLTHCFLYGGADLMLKEVRECLRVDVDRYVRVNFNTFAQLIDSVGGVDIELTEQEAKGLNGEVRSNAWTRVRVHEGVNHLDGYDALQYARLRYIDSDWQRIERQRNILQSVVSAAKGMNLLQLNDAVDTVLPLVQTNLTGAEILELAAFALNVLGAEIEQMSIPVQGSYGGMAGMGGRKLYAVDFEANAQLLRDFLYGAENTQDIFAG